MKKMVNNNIRVEANIICLAKLGNRDSRNYYRYGTGRNAYYNKCQICILLNIYIYIHIHLIVSPRIGIDIVTNKRELIIRNNYLNANKLHNLNNNFFLKLNG